MTAQYCLVAEDIDIVAGSEQQEASGLPHYDDVIDAATTTTTTAQTPPSPAPESNKPKSKLHNNMLSALRKIGSDRESKKLRRDDVRRGRPGAGPNGAKSVSRWLGAWFGMVARWRRGTEFPSSQ